MGNQRESAPILLFPGQLASCCTPSSHLTEPEAYPVHLLGSNKTHSKLAKVVRYPSSGAMTSYRGYVISQGPTLGRSHLPLMSGLSQLSLGLSFFICTMMYSSQISHVPVFPLEHQQTNTVQIHWLFSSAGGWAESAPLSGE